MAASHHWQLHHLQNLGRPPNRRNREREARETENPPVLGQETTAERTPDPNVRLAWIAPNGAIAGANGAAAWAFSSGSLGGNTDSCMRFPGSARWTFHWLLPGARSPIWCD
jgi:hypothetical protein